MFGFEIPNPQIVFQLLSKYDGKAIIHDPAKTPLLAESKTTLPCHVDVDYLSISDADVADLELPELPVAENVEDFAFIHHTSGSVSGMPKAVLKTNKWLSTVTKKSAAVLRIGSFETQDVYVWTYVDQFIRILLVLHFYYHSESFSHTMVINCVSAQSLPIRPLTRHRPSADPTPCRLPRPTSYEPLRLPHARFHDARSEGEQDHRVHRHPA